VVDCAFLLNTLSQICYRLGMAKTRIFVSSTCYDLAAVREDLRRFILQLGHEPLLSEDLSFPVNPSETAIANCKKNVEANSDVLVLIVGGRRGSLDPDSGKSVTNLEYDTARARGVPCFVYISHAVLTLLPVWKKNPNADFSPAVDYPEVFGFIERIQAENRWIFPFDTTAEIEECLSDQLSIMFRALLIRQLAGTLDPVEGYASESAEAQRLARERPKYWEYLLTAELLKTKLGETRRQFERQRKGLGHVPLRGISLEEFINWVPLKIEDLRLASEAVGRQLGVIQASWGSPGQAGEAHTIQQAVNDFIHLCNGLVEWEKDLNATTPPEKARGLRNTMRGWTEVVLREIERLPQELLRPFEGGAVPKGGLLIQLKIEPPAFEDFCAEMEALQRSMSLPTEGSL
jgi:hypothetical protein